MHVFDPECAAPPDRERRFARAEFRGLAETPAGSQPFANICDAPSRRAYANDVAAFAG